MTWFDLLLTLIVALLTAIGAQRKMIGALVGIGSLILFRILLVMLVQIGPVVALLFALAAGVLLGFAGRSLVQRRRGSPLPFTILGGVGGFLLGVLLVLSLVTSLPLEVTVNNTINYPGTGLPPVLETAVRQSYLVRETGRGILLYPLMVDAGILAPNSVLQGLHHFFVVRLPWEGG
jgi:membrane protease YdiL (CAAX protease family)